MPSATATSTAFMTGDLDGGRHRHGHRRVADRPVGEGLNLPTRSKRWTQWRYSKLSPPIFLS
jgi:hypothetical protein